MTAEVRVLGVRHHGPGSARSVETVLDGWRPDVVVIEGPPELDGLVDLARRDDLVPPVAALAYRPDRPARSMFFPMASFSPEWVALRWALASGARVQFADLPATNRLADAAEAEPDEGEGPVTVHRVDPIGRLAAVAGYDDPERWWEDAIEHRLGGADDPLARAMAGFDAIRAAVAMIREDEDDGSDTDILLREAAMRRVLREVLKDPTAQRVAVVCGAFHAPVLHPDAFPTATADTRLLRGQRRIRVAVTWVPWTAGRLALASGYGAGVASPGWYAHCHATPPEQVVDRWMVRVARALRAADLPASSASAVDAARMAQALAALRGRPLAGLAECTDAAQAVLCHGATAPLRLIHDEVVVGHDLGRVPEDTPQVPLAKDLEAQARSARLTRSAELKVITVDLRTDAGLAKSVLLHRLDLLGIRWGRPADAGGTTGTFKEGWAVRWDPDLSVAVIEAAMWGGTVAAAAHARAVRRATLAPDLPGVVAVLDACLPADLPAATDAVVAEVDRRAAGQHDTLALMRAAGPLARTCRYGDVRQIDTGSVRRILDVLIRRAAAGVGPAVTGLDDDSAARARDAVDEVQRAVTLLGDDQLSQLWLDALGRTVDRPRVHPLVAGQLVRLLLDQGRIPASDARDRVGRELSAGRPAREAAAWLDGFLEGDATLLLLDAELLGTIDTWMTTARADAFEDLLPLLRRTFSRYAAAERRQLGERIRHGHRRAPDDEPLDPALAGPAVRHILALMGAGDV